MGKVGQPLGKGKALRDILREAGKIENREIIMYLIMLSYLRTIK